MKLEYTPLTGKFLRLQPFAPELKAEVRAAVDCDPETWAIMPSIRWAMALMPIGPRPAAPRLASEWPTRSGDAAMIV